MGDASGQSKRDKLLELAKRKREEQEELQAKENNAKGPVPDIDFGDSEEEDEPGASTAQHEAQQRPAVNMDDLFGDDDEDEGPSAPTEEDRAFIDDSGVRPEQRVDFEDGDDEQYNKDDEAEEADIEDDLDKLFNKRQRRESQGEYENKALVDSFLAQMEVAVEEDMKDYEQGKPATHKLRMLNKVQQMLATKRLHNELLDGGLLGVLKAWIDPMPDGTLPNSTIRSAILKLLDELPIDCALEDRKAQLKRSGLGRTIMFLAKVSG
ncbi:hypothetical protein QBZ16_005484 [Prototheca wickerhamii]|uniref:TFIIS N-terminal domain-containing protein n=1 Tax=Prototheca wickerhamii TaxID=3111 RepID=A0AAD9MGF0_PROWI|nr:hypothetical protein QBZ16_005484 [Prototheca wickerhamii]